MQMSRISYGIVCALWALLIEFTCPGYLASRDSVDKTPVTAVDPEIIIQQSHLSEISALALVNDGQQLVSASLDGTIRVWDVQSRKLEKVLRVANHVLSPPRIATSPDGKFFAAKILEEEIGIWETSSWTKVSACKHQYVRFFAFSLDSTTLAGTAGSIIFLCDVHGIAPERQLELERTPLSFTFSSDGTEIATATGDKDIQRWDSKTGEELRTLNGHTGHVLAVDFSPTEHILASGGADNTLRLWNVDTGEGQVLTTDTSAVMQVTFSPDGKYLVTKNEGGQTKLWDAGNRQLIATLDSSVQSGSATFSPDGRYLGMVDQRSIINFDLATKGKKAVALRKIVCREIAYDPQSKRMAIGEGADLKTLDLHTGELQGGFGRHTLRVKSLGISGDGAELAAADSAQVIAWNFGNGAVRSFSPPLRIPGRAILTFSPDHSVLAIHADTTLTDRTVTLWNIDTGEKIASMNDNAGPPIAISRKGRYFADIDPDGNAKISSLEGEAILAIPHMKDLRALAFSPSDSLLAAVVTQSQIQVWQLPSAKVSRTIHSNFTGNVLYFLSDNTLVRLKDETTLVAWDVETGKRITGAIIPASVAHNRIASLRGPHEVDIFDLDSRTTVANGNLPNIGTPIDVAEWSAEAEILGTESQTGEIALWKLRNEEPAKKICSAYVYEDGSLVVLDAQEQIDATRVCHF